ncbi:MAG TPA: bifunctional helix-turn-helix transcriptional regulator/GNAT family N-acetyltransferase, partial [Solirubrobacteraceae bacterium]
ARVASVRAFNRFFTRRIGVLQEGLLHTPYSLTEARILFELGQRDTLAVADLRAELGLDAGYLSRLLARLAGAGLVARRRAEHDARRQEVALTASGRAACADLDARSGREIGALLAALADDDQDRLVAAMDEVRDVLDEAPPPVAYVLRPPRAGEYGWIVARHGALYAREYGWDETFEALVARIVADYVDRRDAAREAAWIAELRGRPVGCVLCVAKDRDTAQLRLLLVDPAARGLGIGGRLVEECLRFARAAGYAELTLWTNDVLTDARRIYERAGFTLVDAEPHRSFGRDLVGQHWAQKL